MTKPDDAPEPGPAAFAPPGGEAPSGSAGPAKPAGWGQASGPIGYGQPKYGQYAGGAPVPPGGPASTGPAGPEIPAPQYGQPQYGQPQYGQPVGFGGPGWRPLAAKPGIVPLRPLSLGELYDGAFAAIRTNPKVMLGVVALVISVATILPAILSYLVAPAANRWMDSTVVRLDPTGELGLSGELGLTGLGGQLSQSLFIGIGVYLASIVTTGLLIVAISRAVINKPFTAADLWQQVRGKVLGLITISLLPSLAIMVAATVIFVAAAVVIAVVPALAEVLILALFCAITVAAVWLTVRFLLTSAAYVLENQSLGSAIRRGWLLSRGSFWRLFGIYLLSSIISVIVSSLVALPGSIIATILYPEDYSTHMGGVAIVVITQILASTISTAFLSSVIALLYIDVRMRREGLDVELAAAADAV